MSAEPTRVPDCEREKVVRVSIGEDGYPKVEPDFIEIDRRLDETVVWRADEGVNFTICFDPETPFASYHFHPCLPASGVVREGASGGEYKYCVEINGKVIDPKVGVRPPK